MMNLDDVQILYTNQDDGIHLLCECGWEINLGFGVSLNTALNTARGEEHFKQHGSDEQPPA